MVLLRHINLRTFPCPIEISRQDQSTKVYHRRKLFLIVSLLEHVFDPTNILSYSLIRACRKFYLTEKEEYDIKTCNETARPTLISFIGQVSRSQSRRDLRTLRNESGVVVGGSLELFPSAMLNTTDAGIAFEMLAKRSAFSAAPRGK